VPDLPPPFILIVDDNSTSAQATRDHLNEAGYYVRVASDTDAALEAAAAQRPQLVLLDLNAPGTNIPAFLEKLYALLVQIPVVLISVNPKLKVTAQSRDLQYLQKPYAEQELLKIIDGLAPRR
jgi:DNA-binding response OmpR family regulator